MTVCLNGANASLVSSESVEVHILFVTFDTEHVFGRQTVCVRDCSFVVHIFNVPFPLLRFTQWCFVC